MSYNVSQVLIAQRENGGRRTKMHRKSENPDSDAFVLMLETMGKDFSLDMAVCVLFRLGPCPSLLRHGPAVHAAR